MKVTESETYLGMTLTSDGIKREHNIRQLIGAGMETKALKTCGRWDMAIRPWQIGPAFEAPVRSSYKYGLLFLELTAEMIHWDNKWGDAAKGTNTNEESPKFRG